MKKRPISKKNGGKTKEDDEETATEVCTEACLSLWGSFLMLDHRFTTHLAVCATIESPLGHLRPLMKVLEISCHGAPWIMGSAIFFLCSHKPQDIALSLNLFCALLLDVFVVALLKLTIRRSRPAHNVSDMFGAPGVDKYSFPSGHSTRASIMALFVCQHIFTNRLYSVLMAVWAGAVCISRILLGRHHIVDVVCGIVIGMLSYYTYLRLWITEDTCMTYLDTYFGHIHL